jgi:hypothetical protein
MFGAEFSIISFCSDFCPAKKKRKQKFVSVDGKIDEDPDFQGSDLRGDTNHICSDFSQKVESQRVLILDQKCKFGVVWPKMAIFKVSAPIPKIFDMVSIGTNNIHLKTMSSILRQPKHTPYVFKNRSDPKYY